MTSLATEPLGIAGVEIGHWTHSDARTGCTVIVLPPQTTASGEVRGGAPATREFALLAPERLVETIDAVVLTGGSAFGLATADGVMQVLESEGRGYPTAHGRVPIVVAMALYDLGVGNPSIRPDAEAGRHAAINRSNRPAIGAVGAGTGATVSKWQDADRAQPAGLGIATVHHDDLRVTAVVAVNAAGTPDTSTAASSTRPSAHLQIDHRARESTQASDDSGVDEAAYAHSAIRASEGTPVSDDSGVDEAAYAHSAIRASEGTPVSDDSGVDEAAYAHSAIRASGDAPVCDGSRVDESSILDRIVSGEFTDWPTRSSTPIAPDHPLVTPADHLANSERLSANSERLSANSERLSANSERLSDNPATQPQEPVLPLGEDPRGNTTLCAVITNARLTKLDCFWVAQGGHDGLARSFVPAHCRSDGDAVVAAATGEVPLKSPAEVDDVRLLTVAAVIKAIRQATTPQR